MIHVYLYFCEIEVMRKSVRFVTPNVACDHNTNMHPHPTAPDEGYSSSSAVGPHVIPLAVETNGRRTDHGFDYNWDQELDDDRDKTSSYNRCTRWCAAKYVDLMIPLISMVLIGKICFLIFMWAYLSVDNYEKKDFVWLVVAALVISLVVDAILLAAVCITVRVTPRLRVKIRTLVDKAKEQQRVYHRVATRDDRHTTPDNTTSLLVDDTMNSNK